VGKIGGANDHRHGWCNQLLFFGGLHHN
jgi:hypothetical protein